MTDTNGAGGLPELPKGDVAFREDCLSKWQYAHSADQMHAYGDQCYAIGAVDVAAYDRTIRNFGKVGELCRATREGDGEVDDSEALRVFTEYFVKNYPGPHTIIHNPNWHAPRIFRAAKHALRTLSRVAVQEGMVLVPKEPTCGMVVAAIDRDDSAEDASPDGLYVGIYRAMIAAAQRQEGKDNG